MEIKIEKERERERQRNNVCLCLCVYVCEREKGRKGKRDIVCWRVRETKRGRERIFLCVRKYYQ